MKNIKKVGGGGMASNVTLSSCARSLPPTEIFTPGERFNTFKWKKVDTHKWFASIPAFNSIPKDVITRIERDYREDSIKRTMEAVQEHLLKCNCCNKESDIRIDMQFVEWIDEFGVKEKRLIAEIKIKEKG